MTYGEIASFYREKMGVRNERSVRLLAENTRMVHKKKGDRLRAAGDDMKTILFPLSGTARAYVIDDNGQENVMGFVFMPGYPCLGAPGFGSKISTNIDAVTDMDLLELPIKDLMHAMQNDVQIAGVVHRYMADDYERTTRWILAMKTKFGEDRYKWFLEEYAPVVGVVTQKDIASFLGMRPQSLSRIRRTMDP